jgi:uncharacterized lipoprotein YmbA
VDVPAYLRTGALVIRTGINEVHFAEYERWAEPLAVGMARAIKEHLSSLRSLEFVGSTATGIAAPDCEVTVELLACEGVTEPNESSSIRLILRWEIRSAGTAPSEVIHGQFDSGAVTWDGQHYDRLVVRLGEAVATASAALATELPK